MVSMTMIVSQNHVIQCEFGGSASAQMYKPGDGVFVARNRHMCGADKQLPKQRANGKAQRVRDCEMTMASCEVFTYRLDPASDKQI